MDLDQPPLIANRLIGNHPILKNAFIFNGMGSKSILMAPLLGKQLIEHILFDKKLSESG